MSYIEPPRHGIPKLTRFQGKLCECDVIVQVFLEDRPTDDDEPTQEYNAIVSDANYCFPALVNDFDKKLVPGINLVCVTQAVCCFFPTGQGILIISRFQLVPACHGFVVNFPHRVWAPEPDASRGNPLPLAILTYFPTEIEPVPRTRVLVTYKSLLNDPRDCRSEPGFLVHLLDESDELRAYAKKQAALELYNKLEVGKVYYITNMGNYRRNNEFFFNLHNPNSLELTRFTMIEECHDSSAPKLRFDFETLSKLRGYILDYQMMGSLVYTDVIGIVQTVCPLQIVLTMTRDPRKMVPKREVIIFDQSGQTLLVVLWSHNAEDFRSGPGTIVAFRHARSIEGWMEHTLPNILPTSWQVTSSYLTSGSGNPRLLSVMSTSTVHIEPDVEECFALRQWYNSNPQLPAAPSPQTTENAICEPCL